MTKYIIDTNIWLSYPSIINRLNGTIIVPLTVISELDHQKHQILDKPNRAYMARQAIKELEKLSEQSNSKIELYDNSNVILPDNVDKTKYSVNDNIIIYTILHLKEKYPDDKFILITNDLAMKIKAKTKKIETYNILKETDFDTNEYKGYITISVSDNTINTLYSNFEKVKNDLTDIIVNPINNCFYEFVSNVDNNKKIYIFYNGIKKEFYKILDKAKYRTFGNITPMNIQQTFFAHLLNNTDIPCIQVKGTAGSGKTLMTLSYVLDNVIDNKRFKKFLYLKSMDCVSGNDIGYLPGEKETKMQPFLAPLYDSLEKLMDINRIQAEAQVEDYIKTGKFEIEAISHIRGRSLHNTILVIDEAENLDISALKTLLTRCDEDCRIIVLSDDNQIDNPKLSKLSNGTAIMKNSLVGESLYGFIELEKSVRSKFTNLVVKLMNE